MKTIYIPILFFLFTGCAHKPVSKEIKKSFTNRFEGKNTGIGSLIEVDGYYKIWAKGDFVKNFRTNQMDSFFLNTIFYEDGSFVYNFFSLEGYPKDINGYLKQVVKNGNKDEFHFGFYWGIYTLSNDTIKAQYINNASNSYLAPWLGAEYWFKVRNANTLEIINEGDLGKMPVADITEYNKCFLKYSPAIFHHTEMVPSSYNWLKNQKWLWRNEYDWKKFTDSVRILE